MVSFFFLVHVSVIVLECDVASVFWCQYYFVLGCVYQMEHMFGSCNGLKVQIGDVYYFCLFENYAGRNSELQTRASLNARLSSQNVVFSLFS